MNHIQEKDPGIVVLNHENRVESKGQIEILMVILTRVKARDMIINILVDEPLLMA